MSLATRCPHCNTIFKVVQDQLKVSEGWVRCGRCQEVFNALEGLFDMEREPPPQKMPPAATPSGPATDSAATDSAASEPAASEPAFEPTAPMWAPPSPVTAPAFAEAPAQPFAPPVPGYPPEEAPSPAPSIWQGDILPQEELQAPPAPAPVSEPSPDTRSPLVGDAIEVMDAPQGAVTNFELELPPTAEAMAAAVSNVLQAPFEAAQLDPQALPVTEEADALDSRYLLPNDERQAGRPRRRKRGPEFADAEFPTDAMADAMDWAESWPEPDEGHEPVASPSLSPTRPAPLRGGVDTHATHPHAHEPEFGLLSDEPPAMAQLLSRLEPVEDATAAPHGALAVPDAGPTTIPSRFHEDYQPEQSLPPPSKRKGRPGTRGRSPQAGDEPEFIKQAERKAIWRHPAIRGVLALLALILTLLLVGQVAHQERDLVASRFPALAPWLERWCQAAHCTLQAPMQLDELQVDNIELVRTTSQGEDTYRLTAIIRNRATMPLAWPHLDLSLTDANGEVVVRRVFAVHSALARVTPEGGSDAGNGDATGAVPDVVPASSSTTLQWQLNAPDLPLAGYTAELFYP